MKFFSSHEVEFGPDVQKRAAPHAVKCTLTLMTAGKLKRLGGGGLSHNEVFVLCSVPSLTVEQKVFYFRAVCASDADMTV